MANAPSHTVLNGLTVHRGYVYAADTFGAQIWRVRKTGGYLEVWAADPLLEIPEGVPFPGPNGIRVFRNKIYVSVSATGNIVRFRFVGNGAAGPARVHATLPGGQGCDEFVFDRRGRIYCTTDPFNTVVRLNRDGSSDILLTSEDGLDGPTSVAFGRGRGNRRSLYITNAAFPFFTTTFTPSLMRFGNGLRQLIKSYLVDYRVELPSGSSTRIGGWSGDKVSWRRIAFGSMLRTRYR